MSRFPLGRSIQSIFPRFAALAALSLAVAATAPAQQPPPAAAAQPVAEHCASCHGADGSGTPRGPSIIPYLRYHNDAEVSAVIRDGAAHKSVQLNAGEMAGLLTALRGLTDTKPEMATGGFNGGRSGPVGPLRNARGASGGRGGRGSIAAGTTPTVTGGGRGRGGGGGPSVGSEVTLTLAGGGTLAGKLTGISDFDADVLSADGKMHLLSRAGDTYTEKSIAPKSDWLIYHGTLEGNRYSPLEQINTGNVAKLAPAWMFPVPTSPRLETTPVVADGVMYFTGWNEIYALDATTGRELWNYREPHTIGIQSEAGLGANRGAAISGDRVFMITDKAHLLAFNRMTGVKLWDVEMASYKDNYSATPSPLIAGDLVVQGVAGGEEGTRGFVDAYKISTGEHVWRFYTIPKRGEKGSETWIGQAIDHGCGATWQTGSYDADLGLVYFGVGNPCPDYAGEERIGDNLYTASVVALSVTTGELKWHFQFTPHDTHDWDSTQPMVLVDELWEGRPRKLLVHGDRNGYFYVLDRTNGELLLATPLSTKVTWTTGYGKDGRPILTPTAVSTPEGVATCPGSGGGANWPDAAYSPVTKLFYIRVADTCGVYASSQDPLGDGGGPNGTRWFGTGTPQPKARQDLAALTAGYPTANYIRAVDIFTGKKVWDYPVLAARTGVLSTAGGLLFMGSAGGMIAIDGKTGKAAWHVDMGQLSSSTPMTYMVGGKQYIVLPGTGVVVAYALTE